MILFLSHICIKNKNICTETPNILYNIWELVEMYYTSLSYNTKKKIC